MRIAILAALLLAPLAALADDTKPPSITDVKPSVKGSSVTVEAKITDETGVMGATVHHRSKGGKVEDTNMVKNEYDDVFKATFPGGPDTEFWIDSSDILGNGPSTYGSSSKPMTASGKAAKAPAAVAAREPEPKPAKEPRPEPEPKPEPAEPTHHRGGGGHKQAKAAAEPPEIEHRKASAQPPEGQDFTVRAKIHSSSSVQVAAIQYRAQGSTTWTNGALSHTDGDSYEGKIPAAAAKGTVEYILAARNESGQTHQGDGDAKTPYTLTFKGAGAAAAAASAEKGGWTFSHWPVVRVDANQPLLVRAQVAADDGSVPEKAIVLYRGNDGQDMSVDMSPDANGGLGGFKAELPAQADGAIYYQVVACDNGSAKCVVDTGSKKKWHGTAVGPKGSEPPLPLSATSSKAPSALSE